MCACSSRTFLDLRDIAYVAAAVSVAGFDVVLADDLCEWIETGDERVKQMEGATIVACHERAVKSLMAYAGVDGCEMVSLRGVDAKDALTRIGVDADQLAKDALDEAVARYEQMLKGFAPKQGTDAWYPTIDKDECCECGKCFEFCPFGVYEMRDDRVRVVNPTHCKNNCPACARNCPAGAIIFPKYTHSPINGGSEAEEQVVSVNMKNVYADTLRDRLNARKQRVALLKNK